MKLNEMKIGSSAVITAVGGDGSLRQHFLDMGVIPGATVTLTKYAPMGDPMELRIHGYELTMRIDDAKKVEIKPSNGEQDETRPDYGDGRRRVEHPGLGEGGRYHVPHTDPLPKGTPLTFALAGNQNCGKTTLFNQLTGSNQHVGNFPGVTVDRKSGSIKGHPDASVTDLPGIYSLSPYTSEEIVSRRFILDEKPSGIINIVDATNIERNLYLTLQLMELDVPMVLALNMMDEMRGSGGSVRINEMEERLGIPVIPISASKNEGVDEVVRHALHVAQNHECPGRTDFCSKDENGGAGHRCLHGIMHLIEDHAAAASIPVRFAASKLVEGDARIEAALKLSENEREMIEHIIVQMERERGLDRAAAIADMRFSFITALCRDTVVRPRESREHIRSRRIDRVLTGRFTAIPMFILIMAAIFCLTFGLIGAYLQKLLDGGITALTSVVDAALTRIGVGSVIHSLIVDGIFAGVGSVLSFVPIIVILFFFLSMLEDSGYMARVAFVTDKLLRKIGLSGRSIVPMLIGFGCTVPGVMASRTLPSDRDRKMTIMTTTFVPCGAKLPIIAMIAGAFFNNSGWVATSCYFVGIAAIICSGIILKKTKPFSGKPAPFVMELPEYHIPSVKTVLLHVWERLKAFLIKAGTILVVACIVIWFLSTFGFEGGSFGMVEDTANSLIAVIGNVIAPIFAPLGFGNWQSVASSLTGFSAKEAIVSTMGVLANVAGDTEDAVNVAAGVAQWFPTAMAALSFLIFNLLDSPCLAAISTMANELNDRRWFWFAIIFQNVFAYAVSLMVYQIGSLVLYGTFGFWTVVAFVVLAFMLYMLFRPDPYKDQKVYSTRSVEA